MTAETTNIRDLLHSALAHHQSGRLQQAEKFYRQVLALDPENADANNLLGVLAYQMGKYEAAVKFITRATRTNPGHPLFFNNLGNALKANGNLAGAVAAYQQALTLKPDYGDALYNLGNAYIEQGNPGAAVVNYRKVLAINPDYADAHNNLGKALSDLGLHAEAVASYRRALELRPDYAEAYNNLGNLLNYQGSFTAAADLCRRAIAVKPDYAEAYCNLGSVLLRLGNLPEAIASFQKALRIKPDYAVAHSHIIGVLLYLPAVSQEDIFQQAKKWDERHAKPLAAKQKPHENSRDWNRRLRIGYVSPDFRFHAVNRFFEPLLTAHDRDKFEIYLYSNVQTPDDVSRGLQAKADHWLSIVKMNDAAAVEQIRKDRIDILVDLAKHSADNRLLLFALKPAPVQATWLGYPCTTGMEAMDYRIVDNITHPLGKTDSLNSERLVRLPNGYFCFSPRENGPDVAGSPVAGCGHITFGSFNTLLKIHAEVIDVWAEILKRIAGSRLVMLGKGFAEKPVQQHFVSLFAAHGIGEERIELLPALPYEKYLGMHGKVDIALDPFPYNGHTTTCDTLWMGVPVVTLQGEADCSRVGASILTRIGLPELIAGNRQEYIDKAVELAGDIDRLSALRKGMRARLLCSSLCDVRGFARDMEAAYVTMWRKWSDSAV